MLYLKFLLILSFIFNIYTREFILNGFNDNNCVDKYLSFKCKEFECCEFLLHYSLILNSNDDKIYYYVTNNCRYLSSIDKIYSYNCTKQDPSSFSITFL